MESDANDQLVLYNRSYDWWSHLELDVSASSLPLPSEAGDTDYMYMYMHSGV